jgi:hypothetical protein
MSLFDEITIQAAERARIDVLAALNDLDQEYAYRVLVDGLVQVMTYSSKDQDKRWLRRAIRDISDLMGSPAVKKRQTHKLRQSATIESQDQDSSSTAASKPKFHLRN